MDSVRLEPQCAALVDQLAHFFADDVKFARFYTRRPLNQTLSVDAHIVVVVNVLRIALE